MGKRHKTGAPSWADVSSTDLDATGAFYAALFGWTQEERAPAELGSYTGFRLGDRPVAAMTSTQGGPPAWNVYFDTEDVEATAKAVEAAGGTVIAPPMEIGESGSLAMFTDPAGAFFGVWQAGAHEGFEALYETGAFCWAELASRDVQAASTFYADVLGWAVESSALAPPESIYLEGKVDGQSIAGLMPMPDGYPPQVPSHWAVYFAVEDADATVAKAQELGGSVVAPQMDLPGVGRIAVLADPVGARFAVLQPSADMQG